MGERRHDWTRYPFEVYLPRKAWSKDDIKERRMWCYENGIKKFVTEAPNGANGHYVTFCFANDNEAALFKLVWL